MLEDEKKEAEALSRLKPGIALSWGLGKQPQRGPKRELSIPQIIDTAVAIADQDGLAAVSMGRVAAALGYTAMSLYRYIPSKEDLLLLMQDAVSASDIPAGTEEEEWRQGMREYVAYTVGVFKKHPWFGDIPLFGAPTTPNQLRIVDWALRIMRPLPLNSYEKMSMLLLLSSYARSVGIIQRDFELALRSGSSPEAFSGISYNDALRLLVKPEEYPDLYPLIQSGAYTGEDAEENGVGDDFDFGLDRILDGIEHYICNRGKR